MSWAAKRRLIILIIIGAVVAAFLAVLSIATFYESPTCSDAVQNQGEAGVDCGGPCPYLCRDQARTPVVLYSKALSGGAGRTDVIASVENVNTDAAAKAVPFTVTLYGAKNVFVQKVSGTVDLPPASTVPIFIPGVSSGSQKVVSAFLTIDDSAPKWFTVSRDARTLPVVSNTTLVGTTDAPRIEAMVANPSVALMSNVLVIALVHDDKGNVIAASQTILPSIPVQNQAKATFTWNSAFSGVPAAIEIVPIIPLP